MREYDKFIRGCGFEMRRHKHPNYSLYIGNWEHIISDMVYDGKLTIWKRLEAPEILNAKALFTNLTPKLRKMMSTPDIGDKEMECGEHI